MNFFSVDMPGIFFLFTVYLLHQVVVVPISSEQLSPNHPCPRRKIIWHRIFSVVNRIMSILHRPSKLEEETPIRFFIDGISLDQHVSWRTISMELMLSKLLLSQMSIRRRINRQSSMNHYRNNHRIDLIVNAQISSVPMNPLNLLQDDQWRTDSNRISSVVATMIVKANVKEEHDKVYEVGLNQHMSNIIIDHLLP